MKVCTIVERLCPTVIVPGMIRSLTIFRSLYQAVVCAYEPIPNVSKKFVTKPIARCSALGNRISLAGVRVPEVRARFRPAIIALPQTTEKTVLRAASAAKRAEIGFMRKSPFQVLEPPILPQQTCPLGE